MSIMNVHVSKNLAHKKMQGFSLYLQKVEII